MCELNFELKEELMKLREKSIMINNRKKYLNNELSRLDKKQQDILHCAEFYSLDAYKGYKLYKILHETRIERRRIKDELDVLTKVYTHISIGSIENAIHAIKNMEECTKTYTPRVVDELFDLLK